jgi:hypothetical protein
MVGQYDRISRMVNRTADVTVSGRVTAEEHAAAQKVLDDARDWTMPSFLIACVRALAAKPAELLALIGPHRAVRPPRGRPRRKRPPEG